MIPDALRDILVCPACHGELAEHRGDQRLDCRVCGRRYPVRDGIPIMLIEEAEQPSEEHAELDDGDSQK